MSDLFEKPKDDRPYKVQLPGVITPVHHYMVRWWLLDTGWIEFQDWMISRTRGYSENYEVWFTDIGKATYFKLSFTI